MKVTEAKAADSRLALLRLKDRTDLLNDPDPTPAYEEENPSDEPRNRALNSVRGSAMLSLFEYARWIYRSNGGYQQRPDVAVLAPEAVALLDQHQRPQVESRPTIRSAYGQGYVSIYAMSKSWTVPATPRVFCPPVVAVDAAWMTYLALNNVYDDIFKLLRLRHHEARAEPTTASASTWAQAIRSRRSPSISATRARPPSPPCSNACWAWRRAVTTVQFA
jgi:hypothetical protein